MDKASEVTTGNVTGKVKGKVKGVTLIELAFVIGIIAVIVVGALAIFNAVRASQDRSTALQNVGTIRSAIATWAGDKPLGFGTQTGLQFASQLRPWLPGRLGTSATTSGLILTAANPWEGNYEIRPAETQQSGGNTGGGTGHPYRFLLVITGVPEAQAQALCRQLEDGATLDESGAVGADGSARRRIGLGGLDSGCTGGTSAAGTLAEIHVEYRV